MLYCLNNTYIQSTPLQIYNLNFVYATGELQNILGYDLLCTNDIKLYNRISSISNNDEKFITNCYVSDNENRNIAYISTLYVWYSEALNQTKGLVCLRGDNETNMRCISSFSNESDIL